MNLISYYFLLNLFWYALSKRISFEKAKNFFDRILRGIVERTEIDKDDWEGLKISKKILKMHKDCCFHNKK